MSRTTGWPPGLLQDDSRELSTWLASRPGTALLIMLCALLIGVLAPPSAVILTGAEVAEHFKRLREGGA